MEHIILEMEILISEQLKKEGKVELMKTEGIPPELFTKEGTIKCPRQESCIFFTAGDPSGYEPWSHNAQLDRGLKSCASLSVEGNLANETRVFRCVIFFPSFSQGA